jgi:hypothetical protein
MNETLTPSESSAGPRAPLLRQIRFRLGALVVVLVLVGIVIWLASGGDNSSSTSSPPSSSGAVAVSPSGLGSLAQALRQPIYWVGPKTNISFELARPSAGRILVGYLPPGVKAGERKPHLMVGTYPISNAYTVTQNAAHDSGAVGIDVGGGAVAFYKKAYPLSAFISYPGSDYQIEVYDPKPGRARQLVAAGEVSPVPGSPAGRTRSVAISAKDLAKRATAAHQPIYWAGPQRKVTYELTKTSQRWFLVRYLPPGVAIGSTGPYLSVGTYPVTDAFAAVQQLANAQGAESIKLPRRGLAVVNEQQFPKSVFLAYPGSNYQVEVFDSSLGHARQLVTSGQITAVR